ncbi:GNAT family N-acetyltransferase [Actinacidiphila glaucinigra]|uniref:GNAT family N-acetyltransferase n=1 Tax=Actinacidiphila glaucinigra TaxID=235986 RepID=UPI0036810EF2
MSLIRILADAAAGVFPPADGSVTVLPQPAPRDAGVIAFTAHAVVFADADPERIHGLLPPGDLSAPLGPPFLTALCGLLDRTVDNIDLLTAAPALPGPPPVAPGLPLRESADRDHPRIARALRHRDQVRAWTVPGGTVLTGRGVAGRWEAAVEVDPEARGAGLGRRLALAARHLVPEGGAVWAQVAPGNAAGVRAFTAAGFVPMGAEALLLTREG